MMVQCPGKSNRDILDINPEKDPIRYILVMSV